MELLLAFSIHMIILFVLTREPILDWIFKSKYRLLFLIILSGGMFAVFFYLEPNQPTHNQKIKPVIDFFCILAY